MDLRTLPWLSVTAAALVVGVAAATAIVLDDDDGEEALAVDLPAGGAFTLTALSPARVDAVEADYELRNDGDAPALVELILTAPDGEAVAAKEMTVEPGASVEIEVERAFADGGPVGAYTATLRVAVGDVHVAEGSLDFNEPVDGVDA